MLWGLSLLEHVSGGLCNELSKDGCDASGGIL